MELDAEIEERFKKAIKGKCENDPAFGRDWNFVVSKVGIQMSTTNLDEFMGSVCSISEQTGNENVNQFAEQLLLLAEQLRKPRVNKKKGTSFDSLFGPGQSILVCGFGAGWVHNTKEAAWKQGKEPIILSLDMMTQESFLEQFDATPPDSFIIVDGVRTVEEPILSALTSRLKDPTRTIAVVNDRKEVPKFLDPNNFHHMAQF